MRHQEILRRLAIIDDGFVEDQAGLGLDRALSLDPKIAALVRVGALAAIGSPAVWLEWSAARALAAGATEDEITDVLLAIAPVAGLGRVVSAVPGVADAFGYDIEPPWRTLMTTDGASGAPDGPPTARSPARHLAHDRI